jgi:hypothetical protein
MKTLEHLAAIVMFAPCFVGIVQHASTNDGAHGSKLWALYQPPAAPVMVAEPAFTSSTQNMVFWTAVATATTYTVQCDDAPDFILPVATADESSPTLSHLFMSLSDGQTYWYRVRAQNASGLSAWSAATSSTQDASLPTASMSSTVPYLTNLSAIPVTVTFSEPVMNLSGEDIVTSNSSAGGFNGSGTNYTFNLEPSGQGLVMADIPAGVAQDEAGNDNVAVASPVVRMFDSLGPRLTNVTAGNFITLEITFHEPVSNADQASNYTCTGGVRVFEVLRLSDTRYLLTTSDQIQGTTYTLTALNAVTDRAGNPVDPAYCSRLFTGGILLGARSWQLYR